MKWMTHVKSCVRTLNKFVLDIFKSNNGFTLIEAIITVAIVGIIVAPISMVFLGSLNDTIESKEVLKANQISQLYIENIKMRSFEELESLFLGGDTLVLRDDDISENAYYYGLPEIPNNMRVEISIDRSIYEAEADYEVSKPDEADEIGPEDGDVYINFDYSPLDVPTVYFYHFTDLNNSFYSEPIDKSQDEIIYNMRFDNDLLVINNNAISDDGKVEIPENGGYQNYSVYGIDLNESNLDQFVINVAIAQEDMKTTVGNNDISVVFEVSEWHGTTAAAFILRDSDEFFEPIIETENGLVLAKYNIMERNISEYYIGKIVVDIYKESTNELISTISATKVFD